MTFDMSAGNKPWLTLSEDPTAMAQSSPSWLPGLSDGPDNLQDELSALRLDLTREFEGGALKSLAFGARRSERDKDFFRRQQEFISPTNGAALPASLFTSYRIGEFDVPLKLHREVTVPLKVKVVKEGA
jgi:hypothetical protein